MLYTIFVIFKKKYLIALAVGVLFNNILFSQLSPSLSIEVPQQGITVQLNPTNSVMFEYNPGRESVRDILDLVRRGQIRPLDSFSRGYNTNTYWIYTIAHNYSGAADFVLSESRGHNVVVLYSARLGSPAADFIEEIGGVSIPKSQSKLKSPESAFKLNIPENSSVELLIEISSKTSISPKISIQQEDDFDNQLQNKLLAQGFFIGLIACAIVVSLIVLASSRLEKWIWVYILLLASIVLLHLYVTNLGAVFLWPDDPIMAEIVYPLACLLFNFTCIETISKFFDGAKNFPQLHKVRLYGIIISVLAGLAFWFLPPPLGSTLILLSFVIHAVFFGLITAQTIKQRLEAYVFFTIILVLYLGILGLIVLENFGIVKSSPVGVNTSQALFIPLCLLVLFAHFYKVNKARSKILGENNLLASSQSLQRQDLLKKELELQNASTELNQSEEYKGQLRRMETVYSLVSNLAHELSSPLGNCITVIGALESKMKLEKATSESLDLINRNIQKATAILDEFKAISSSYREIEAGDISLSSIVEKSFFDRKTMLKSHDISFNISIDTNIVLKANPSRILKLFEVLIENSILHGFGPLYAKTSQFKHIVVSATQTTDRIEIRFSDTGIGIAPEMKAGLFEVSPSHGLGLSVANAIVKSDLKGDFRLDESNVNGSTFIITLAVA